jgi:hypothetical protein
MTSLVRTRIKTLGVTQAVNGLMMDMSSPSGRLAAAMRYAANAIWIPNIEERLFHTDTSQSNYRAHMFDSMKNLSPGFVQALGNASGWADVLEWQRVNDSGGYKDGEISQAIRKAIKASQVMQIGGVLAIGIGNISDLESATAQLDGNNAYKMWEILQYGTGTFAGKGEIIRVGKQIFYDDTKTSFVGGALAQGEHGILASQTKSAGFKGREYFVQLDGTMHESDLVTQVYVLNEINRIIKKWSFKKGGGVRG